MQLNRPRARLHHSLLFTSYIFPLTGTCRSFAGDSRPGATVAEQVCPLPSPLGILVRLLGHINACAVTCFNPVGLVYRPRSLARFARFPSACAARLSILPSGPAAHESAILRGSCPSVYFQRHSPSNSIYPRCRPTAAGLALLEHRRSNLFDTFYVAKPVLCLRRWYTRISYLFPPSSGTSATSSGGFLAQWQIYRTLCAWERLCKKGRLRGRALP